jgi:Uma2 family endonuclease
MSDPAKQNRKATYDDILKLPENMVGEIIGGELFVSPRPANKHALAATRLTGKLEPKFGGGGEGPGGWWIISEPEIHVGKKPDEEVYVPDLAGWRRERMPEYPDAPFFELVPDWVCEILSPSNMRLDRTKKVPQYASLGVKHLWLINPRDKTLEVLRLENGKWVLLSTHVEADKVTAEPFQSMEFDLGALWG